MRKLFHVKNRSVKAGAQRGQAMTEFTIAAACVLVPLFLMLPFLGKFMDMKATSIQAARYAAWERTVWYGSDQWESGQKTDQQIKNEVVQRFFNDTADKALTSSDLNSPAGSPKALWTDHAGATILGNTNSTSAVSSTPGTINTYLAIFRNGVNLVGAVLDTKFKLDTSSLYTSTVTLTAAKTDAMALAWNGDVLKGGNVGLTAPTFTERNVLVANGWSANGPAFVKKQTEGLAVFNVFNRPPVSNVIGTVQKVVGIFVEELDSSSLKVGVEIKPDLVPPDRLSAAAVTAVKPVPVPTPRKTPEQEAADRSAAANAAADAVKAKAKALDEGIKNTQASIDSCKAAKDAEYNSNRYIQHSDYVCDAPTVFGCAWGHTNRWTEDKGPGNNYTPKSDANVACHAGLDQQIADLQAKLNDPDLQKAKTESDKALAKSDADLLVDPTGPNLRADADFMKNRAETYKVISDYQAQIDNLKRQKNAI